MFSGLNFGAFSFRVISITWLYRDWFFFSCQNVVLRARLFATAQKLLKTTYAYHIMIAYNYLLGALPLVFAGFSLG